MSTVNKMKITSLIISFLWIGLGTVIQISTSPAYNYFGFDYNSFFYNFLWWITFPFNVLLFGLLYADKLNNIYIFVILLQFVKILIYWWIIYKVCLSLKKTRNNL
jgi:hypothetical protein